MQLDFDVFISRAYFPFYLRPGMEALAVVGYLYNQCNSSINLYLKHCWLVILTQSGALNHCTMKGNNETSNIFVCQNDLLVLTLHSQIFVKDVLSFIFSLKDKEEATSQEPTYCDDTSNISNGSLFTIPFNWFLLINIKTKLEIHWKISL